MAFLEDSLEVIRGVPSADLLRGDLEMLTRSFVMV